MRALITIFLLFTIITSCQKDPQYSLIGSWRLSTPGDPNAIPPPVHSRSNHVLTFFNDSIVDTKEGYFEVIGQGDESNGSRFMGTATKYKIFDDSLHIWNPEESKWRGGMKIIWLSPNRLVLRGPEKDSEFERVEYDLSGPPVFDEIVLSTSGCFGTCPVMDILVRSNGDVYFYGIRFTETTGYFHSKISPERFNEVEKEFRKADPLTLEPEYAVDHTDDEYISTTFIKDSVILTSVRDYGGAGPDELVWAYPKLRDLDQELNLILIDSAKCNFRRPFRSAWFAKDQTELGLLQSEAFLLSVYLNHARQVETIPVTKLDYKLTVWIDNENDEPRISTDGRYYKVEYRDEHSRLLLDIGFNFLERNGKIDKFTPMENR